MSLMRMLPVKTTFRMSWSRYRCISPYRAGSN